MILEELQGFHSHVASFRRAFDRKPVQGAFPMTKNIFEMSLLNVYS